MTSRSTLRSCFFFSSRRRHTRCLRDWSSDVCSSDLSDLVGEYQETILVRNAKGYNVGTTLFGLMSRLKTEEAENNEYNWFERNPTKRVIYADGARSEERRVGKQDRQAGRSAHSSTNG